MIESEYLSFTRLEVHGRKTPILCVYSKSSGDKLGEIAWFGRWRQFCFRPALGALFNKGCLNDINSAIDALMAERRKA